MSKIQMNLVTVIVPTYNRKFSLKECIYSVLNQSYDNFELLIMDDGSTDQTKTKIDEFDQKYKNIHIVESKSNHSKASQSFFFF